MSLSLNQISSSPSVARQFVLQMAQHSKRLSRLRECLPTEFSMELTSYGLLAHILHRIAKTFICHLLGSSEDEIGACMQPSCTDLVCESSFGAQKCDHRALVYSHFNLTNTKAQYLREVDL